MINISWGALLGIGLGCSIAQVGLYLTESCSYEQMLNRVIFFNLALVCVVIVDRITNRHEDQTAKPPASLVGSTPIKADYSKPGQW